MTGEHARKDDMMGTRENARYAGETREMAGRTYEKALCRRNKREGDMTWLGNMREGVMPDRNKREVDMTGEHARRRYAG